MKTRNTMLRGKSPKKMIALLAVTVVGCLVAAAPTWGKGGLSAGAKGGSTALKPAASDEDEVKARLAQLYAASTNGDLNAIDGLFSGDPHALLLGTDPTEVVTGHTNIVQFWQDIFQALGSLGYPNNGGLPIVAAGPPLQVDVHGAVAWVADQPTFQFAHGSVPFRLTAVFHKEGGEWRIIQIHFSIGVPNSTLPI